MTVPELIRKRQQEDRQALRNRRMAGGANLQFTWLDFVQGQNQQDSNGNSIVPPNPYDNKLVYVQVGGAVTVIDNPTGFITLTGAAPEITEIHCHNAPLFTGIEYEFNSSLVTVDFVNLPALEYISFDSSSGLVTLDLSDLGNTVVDYLDLNFCTSLVTLNLNGINDLREARLGFCSALFNFTADDLVTNDIMELGACEGLFVLYLPLFQTSTNYFNYNECTLLQGVNLPALTDAVTFGGNSCPNLFTLSFPSLANVGALEVSDLAGITSLSLLSLVTAGGINGTLTPFVTLDLGAVTFIDGATINFFDCALDETSVDLVLQLAVDSGMTEGIIDLSGGTSSAPSGAGAANAAILVLAGVEVYTN